MTLRKRLRTPSAKSALTSATQTPENTGNTGVLMLSIAPQIKVQNANAPGAGNTTTRSDQDEHVRGVVMANAHPIFAAWILRNPSLGSARP